MCCLLYAACRALCVVWCMLLVVRLLLLCYVSVRVYDLLCVVCCVLVAHSIVYWLLIDGCPSMVCGYCMFWCWLYVACCVLFVAVCCVLFVVEFANLTVYCECIVVFCVLSLAYI